MMRCYGVLVMATLATTVMTPSNVNGQDTNNGRGRGFSHVGFNMYPNTEQQYRRDPGYTIQHPTNPNPLPADSGLAKAFWNQPKHQQNPFVQNPPQQNAQRRQDQDLAVEEEPPRWVQNQHQQQQQQQQQNHQRWTNQNTPQFPHQPIHFRDFPNPPKRQRPPLPPPPVPLQRIPQDIEAIIADALDESKPVMFF